MTYYINRAGQQFGPYTLADLQKYLNEGNVVPTDLARGEGMQNWVPVTQIVGAAAAPPPAGPAPAPPQPAYGQPAAGGPAPAQPSYGPPAGGPAAPQPAYVQPGPWQQPYAQPAAGAPLPPSLHWALVMVLSLVTCGIFGIVWAFIQASWVKKIVPTNNTTVMYILYLCCTVIANVLSIGGAIAEEPAISVISFFPSIGGLVFFLIGIFRLRSDMQNYYNTVEPINLRLSGVMTFFFNLLYFQYHMKRIYDWKTTGMIQPQ